MSEEEKMRMAMDLAKQGIDLLRDRLVCYDGNFSCYDWELENSNIYLFTKEL